MTWWESQVLSKNESIYDIYVEIIYFGAGKKCVVCVCVFVWVGEWLGWWVGVGACVCACGLEADIHIYVCMYIHASHVYIYIYQQTHTHTRPLPSISLLSTLWFRHLYICPHTTMWFRLSTLQWWNWRRLLSCHQSSCIKVCVVKCLYMCVGGCVGGWVCILLCDSMWWW